MKISILRFSSRRESNLIFTQAQALGAQIHPQSYWAEAASHIDWSAPYRQVLPESATSGPLAPWFPGGALNLCENALDRHVRDGLGEKTALIYDSAVQGTVTKYTYKDLLQRVCATAKVLRDLGVKAGDTVVIYMPMVPEAVEAMLACARIGAVHSVVFGGFAAAELAKRIADCKPAAILSASCGLEPKRAVDYKALLDEALSSLSLSPPCLILQRLQMPCKLTKGRDVCWSAVSVSPGVVATCPPISVPSEQDVYILYTSGTTGGPKGIVRPVGGYTVMLQQTMESLYGVKQNDTVFTASDIGWIVGHSYIVYGPLLVGATTVLFEGKPVGTPDPGTFWRVVQDHKVNMLFTAPTALRAIKREDPTGQLRSKYDTSSLRRMFLAGERSDPDTLHWISHQLKDTPVIDHWWQTETGSPITSYPYPWCYDIPKNKEKFGSAGLPTPGWAGLSVIDPQSGEPVPANTLGEIMLQLPLPPGAMTGMYKKPFADTEKVYLQRPGWFSTFDAGLIDNDGFVHVMTRTDDIINVAGHRLSTGALEEVLCSHPDVAEGAVVGVKCSLKGEVPVALYVRKAGRSSERSSAQCSAELVELIRNKVGAIATPTVHEVEKLPKTRSGKVLRKVMRSVLNGEIPSVPATVEDPQAVEYLIARFLKK